MMLSKDKFFRTLTGKLVSLGHFTNDEENFLLEEFGGIEGVISNDYYISASETLAREMARKNSPSIMIEFFTENGELLTTHPEFMYYFVEAVVDRLFSLGNDPSVIIISAPEPYQKYLRRRFLGGDI